MMEVNVRQERADDRALRRPFFRLDHASPPLTLNCCSLAATVLTAYLSARAHSTVNWYRRAGLEKALAAVWEGVPVQRCTVHKHRNLLAHAPERLHEEVTAFGCSF